MKVKLSEIVRKKIKKALKENAAIEMHRSIDGQVVPFGCDACVDDLNTRIIDARHSRDECSARTDSREHYNGILKVLRRKLRRANRVNEEGSY